MGDRSRSYKIEKSVPLPLPVSGGKYPWGKMMVGDSFYVPFAEMATPKNLNQILLSSARHYNNRLEPGDRMKFTTRKDENGVRIWRIK